MEGEGGTGARPVYLVVAGPNGSGKSTLVEKAQRAGFDVGPFINPDVVARSLPPGTAAPDLVAGKEALRQSTARMASGQSFSRESTLTSREILRSMTTAKRSGFDVHVLFVAVKDVEESIERVKHRVAAGGHDIPEDVQRRRFAKSLANAALATRIADRVKVFENPRGGGHRPVAVVEGGVLTRLATDRPAWVDQVVAGLDRSPRLRTGVRSRSPSPEQTRPSRVRDQGDEQGL